MIKIQEADISHLGIIIDFQIQNALETENIFLNKNKVYKGVHKVLNDPLKGRYYVAMEDDSIIGTLLITYEWSDWKNGTILWIQSVYIMPEYRNKGVFTKIYKHLKKMVIESNELIGLRLYVNKTNIIAKKTYEKVGMISNHFELYEWNK